MSLEKLTIPQPNKAEQTTAENETERFHGQDTINGHEIVCSWYEREYEMHFPQIDFPISDEGKKMGIGDQNIRISRNKKDAKFVFTKAKEWATEEDNIYSLYKRVESLAQSL